MESSALVPLPEGFYQTFSEMLTKKKEEALHSKSILSIKEFENMRKILVSIQAKREEKIVLMAIRGDEASAGLTAEEKDLLSKLKILIESSRGHIKSVWENESLNGTKIGGLKIKIVQDVAQYKGIDNAVYGPFKCGEEHTLPAAEAEWLLKAGMANPL